MSNYGHLTQSTIIPKKSKQIQVGSSGLGQLSAILMQGKRQATGPIPMPKYISKKKPVMRQSTQIVPKQSNNQYMHHAISQTKLIQNKLKLKSKMYQQLQKLGGQSKDGLINFVQKSIQNNTQYQNLKKQFYKQKIEQINEKKQNVNKYFQLSNNQDRQRVAWQKRMLEQISDIKKQLTQDKVQQSYDKVLTKDQRQALKQVLKEEEIQRNRLQQAKKKKQFDYQQRINKLIKLGVLQNPAYNKH